GPMGDTASVVLDLTEAKPRLRACARDFIAPAAKLLDDDEAVLPRQRSYRLLHSKIEGAANHRDLMQGLALAPGGTARRMLAALGEPNPDIEKAIRARRNLTSLAETPANALTDPDRLLAQIKPTLASLPADQGAAAALAIANQYVHMGQWSMAKEAYLLLVDRYPNSPQAVDGYRWLIQHNSSSEARRRQERGHFMAVANAEYRIAGPNTKMATERVKFELTGSGVEATQTQQLYPLG